MSKRKCCIHCVDVPFSKKGWCDYCGRGFDCELTEEDKAGYSSRTTANTNTEPILTREERSEIVRLGYMNIYIPICLIFCLTGAGALVALPLAWYFHSQVKSAPKELVAIGTRIAGGILLRMILIPIGIAALVFIAALVLVLLNMSSNGGTFR